MLGITVSYLKHKQQGTSQPKLCSTNPPSQPRAQTQTPESKMQPTQHTINQTQELEAGALKRSLDAQDCEMSKRLCGLRRDNASIWTEEDLAFLKDT